MAEDAMVELAAEIVSAYVSNNSVAAADLPALIASVHASLDRTAKGEPEVVEAKPVPAVPIKKSITPDYIISLEDGRKYKSLKRHLRTTHNMSPDDYRAKWGLPADYPMVAPNYAAARSALAKTMGLGQQRGRTRAKAETVLPPVKRGQKSKSIAAQQPLLSE